MVVDVDEVLHEGAQNVKLPPLLLVEVSEVDFEGDLIDVLQVFNGEVLESVPFGSLSVSLQENPLLS